MKILYTASVLSHICQFHLPVMEALKNEGYEIHVAARDNTTEKNGLKLQFADKYFNINFQRSPKSLKNLDAYRKLKQVLQEEKYDIVICNTPMVGILTRLAANKARKHGTKVVYIAHGFHFYTGAPKKYWMIYPIEKFFAEKYTDLLITINKEDYERAKAKFNCATEHIYGVGVRTNRYHPATIEEQRTMRNAQNLSEEDFVVICSKELMFDNNQKTLLKAAAKIKDKIPNLKVLIAGNGPDDKMLKDLTLKLGLNEIVRFLGYRTDLERIVPSADVVVSCSYREGMPLNIIEAMLCARPIVASRNRGHNELIDDNSSGLLFDMLDSDALAEKVMKIYQDKALASQMGENAYKKVQNYTADSVVNQMTKIVSELRR